MSDRPETSLYDDDSDEISSVYNQVQQGNKPSATVRTMLSWFGAQRRSWRNVAQIRATLDRLGIVTIPDFEGEYIDGMIEFRKKEATVDDLGQQSIDNKTNGIGTQTSTVVSDNIAFAQQAQITKLPDPIVRVRRLPSANKTPVSVRPNSTISEAVTLMLSHDYSQLPVMTSERELKGLVSWKSIGSRMFLESPYGTVQECMEPGYDIPDDASLFDAVVLILQHECVIIRDSTRRICGIITASDIGIQFHQLAEPFMLLSEIENNIRRIIAAKFSNVDLQSAKNPADVDRQIKDVNDLTFGEYVRLLEREDGWQKLSTKIDRKIFVTGLKDVRDIRNDVMHFEPDGIGPDDMKKLRDYARFLNRCHRIGLGKSSNS